MTPRWNLLSCKHFSEVASKKLDQPLSGWERFFFRFHYIICLVCRRFFRQISTIDVAARSHLSEIAENAESGPRLSEAARVRMDQELAKAKDQN